MIDVLDLLGRIKIKIENCSRSYTALWILDTLIECWKKYESHLDISFKSSIDRLQLEWNYIYEPVREQRKQLLGQKCIDFFIKEFQDWKSIISEQEFQDLSSNENLIDNPSEKWSKICKQAQEQGWTEKESYKRFLGKLMVEMTKY